MASCTCASTGCSHTDTHLSPGSVTQRAAGPSVIRHGLKCFKKTLAACCQMIRNAQAVANRVQQLHRWCESSKSLHILAKTFHRHNLSCSLSKTPPSSKDPKCHPTCISAWYKSPLCFTKERGFHLGVCWVHTCAYEGVHESVHIPRGRKLKAAGEPWLQSSKTLTRLLYLPCWQFLAWSLDCPLFWDCF